jgi:hypothetical protein
MKVKFSNDVSRLIVTLFIWIFNSSVSPHVKRIKPALLRFINPYIEGYSRTRKKPYMPTCHTFLSRRLAYESPRYRDIYAKDRLRRKLGCWHTELSSGADKQHMIVTTQVVLPTTTLGVLDKSSMSTTATPLFFFHASTQWWPSAHIYVDRFLLVADGLRPLT